MLFLVPFFCSISVGEVDKDSQQQIAPTSVTIAETTYLRAKEGYTGELLGAEVNRSISG